MKKVEALIRPERLETVMDELRKLGYPGVTITEVKGHGKQKGITHRWRGAEYRVEFLPKIKVEAVVLDEDMGRVAGAVVRAARTGSIGDGKVFIYDVMDAVRIRTGESGFNAI
ncbi:MAG: P-II family nitrogen regulator [Actinomycetota bacterium]